MRGRGDGKGWSRERRERFFAGLAASGNVRMAIAPLGVTAGAAHAKRRNDPEFAAEWVAAMRAAAEGLGQALPRRASHESPLPGEGDAHPRSLRESSDAGASGRFPQAGGENRVIRRNCKGVTQIRQARGDEWTATREGDFFSALAATANVSASARHAGFGAHACYVRRANFPAFRDQWEAALEEGEAYLQWKLIERATDLLESATIDREGAAAALPPPDPTIGIAILAHLARRKAGTQRRTGRRASEPSVEAVRDEVMRRLAAIERGDHVH